MDSSQNSSGPRGSESSAERTEAERLARRTGRITLVAWIAAGLATLAFDPGKRLEGVLGQQIWLFLFVASLGSALVATPFWAFAVRRAQRARDLDQGGMPRRGFLGLLVRGAGMTAAGGLVAGSVAASRAWGWFTVTGPAMLAETPTESEDADPAWAGARVQNLRRLGRTEAMVSDISLGSARIHPEMGGEELARAALDRGVNYFDTAPDYSAAGSELALGRAMQGRRDQVFLATKFCTPEGHLPRGSSVREYMSVVEASLERLQTDHVDLVHVHACDDVDRLMDPNVHEAFDRLKEQGKARFLGVSTHTPNLEQVANTALDSGRFDVLMLAYHFGAWKNLSEIIDRAKRLDVGVVAMKTLKGAHHEGLLELTQRERRSYPQAAFRWVLSNPSVSSLVISFSKAQHLDEYLAASGQGPSDRDVALLEKYDRLIAGNHCVPHCGACLDSCPEGLPIHDILRHKMYFESYGDQKEAMRLYGKLERNAAACIGCPAPCAGSCPHGVSIASQMRDAHRLLS